MNNDETLDQSTLRWRKADQRRTTTAAATATSQPRHHNRDSRLTRINNICNDL
jgi:hypothetical protein